MSPDKRKIIIIITILFQFKHYLFMLAARLSKSIPFKQARLYSETILNKIMILCINRIL